MISQDINDLYQDLQDYVNLMPVLTQAQKREKFQELKSKYNAEWLKNDIKFPEKPLFAQSFLNTLKLQVEKANKASTTQSKISEATEFFEKAWEESQKAKSTADFKANKNVDQKGDVKKYQQSLEGQQQEKKLVIQEKAKIDTGAENSLQDLLNKFNNIQTAQTQQTQEQIDKQEEAKANDEPVQEQKVLTPEEKYMQTLNNIINVTSNKEYQDLTTQDSVIQNAFDKLQNNTFNKADFQEVVQHFNNQFSGSGKILTLILLSSGKDLGDEKSQQQIDANEQLKSSFTTFYNKNILGGNAFDYLDIGNEILKIQDQKAVEELVNHYDYMYGGNHMNKIDIGIAILTNNELIEVVRNNYNLKEKFLNHENNLEEAKKALNQIIEKVESEGYSHNIAKLMVHQYFGHESYHEALSNCCDNQNIEQIIDQDLKAIGLHNIPDTI